MSKLVKLEAAKTYATEANAIKAFESKFAGRDVRYIIMKTDDGRFFPVGLGEKALQAMVHFHFNVLG